MFCPEGATLTRPYRHNSLADKRIARAGSESRPVDYYLARNRRGAYPQNRGRTRFDTTSCPRRTSKRREETTASIETVRVLRMQMRSRPNRVGPGEQSTVGAPEGRNPRRTKAPDPRKLDYYPGRGNRR